MKFLFLILLLIFAQLTLCAQSNLPTFSSGKIDTLTFIQRFPKKVQFVLAYFAESFWWSNIESFRLLTYSTSKWEAWTYYRRWKNSSKFYANKGEKKNEYFKEISVLDSSQVKELFDSLSVLHFWDLNIDSLNETRDHVIFDDVNYEFQIETSNGRQVLESYAPEFYVGMFPDMTQRITFLKGKEIFERWWQRYCEQQNDE